MGKLFISFCAEIFYTFNVIIKIFTYYCCSPYDETDAIEAVRQAIKQGVNYIDTAPWYGQGRSETTLGKVYKFIKTIDVLEFV